MQPKPIHFIAGWFALAALGGLALVVPPAKAMGKLRREVRSLQTELAKPADGPEVLERLASDLQSLRAFGKGRMTPIPNESDVAGLMGMLGETLDDLGLNQRDITTRPPKSYGDATSMPVTVVLNGPFTNIYQAVSRIETMPRLVRIERLRVTAELPKGSDVSVGVRGRDREGIVRAEFSIDAFYSPELPATDSGAPGGEQGAKP